MRIRNDSAISLGAGGRPRPSPACQPSHDTLSYTGPRPLWVDVGSLTVKASSNSSSPSTCRLNSADPAAMFGDTWENAPLVASSTVVAPPEDAVWAVGSGAMARDTPVGGPLIGAVG